MAATRRVDREEYIAATTLAREVRASVADQVRDSIVERDEMAGRSEMAGALERILFMERRLAEARARVKQARVEGAPVGRHVQAIEEFEELYRAAVMTLGVVCGGWVAGMDYEKVRLDVRLEERRREEPPDA